jgi:ribose 5-phosphate isomerase A
MGVELSIRQKNDSNFITDNGNLVADCLFKSIPDPAVLNEKLHQVPGVVETGIFLHTIVTEVIVGYNNGLVNFHEKA